MRLAAAPVFKTSLLFGLLASSVIALPTTLDQDGANVGEIVPAVERRGLIGRAPMPPPHPVNAPDAPVHPPGASGPDAVAPGGHSGGALRPGESTPNQGGALRPGSGTQNAGNGNRPPAGTPEELQWRGQRDLQILKNTPADKVGSYKDYNEAVAKDYWVPEPQKTKLDANSVEDMNEPETLAFFKNNGIEWGTKDKPGMEAQKTNIYGGNEQYIKENGLYPGGDIFEGFTVAEQGAFIRTHQYRVKEDSKGWYNEMYADKPEGERIYMSEHLAATWDKTGGGKPMEKLFIGQMDNDQMAPVLRDEVAKAKAAGNFDPAVGLEAGPGHHVYEKAMGGSAGNPLVQGMIGHPDTYKGWEPKKFKYTETPSGSLFGVIENGPK